MNIVCIIFIKKISFLASVSLLFVCFVFSSSPFVFCSLCFWLSNLLCLQYFFNCVTPIFSFFTWKSTSYYNGHSFSFCLVFILFFPKKILRTKGNFSNHLVENCKFQIPAIRKKFWNLNFHCIFYDIPKHSWEFHYTITWHPNIIINNTYAAPIWCGMHMWYDLHNKLTVCLWLMIWWFTLTSFRCT